MKKVISIILLITLLLLNISIVKAVEPATAQVSFNTPTTLQAGTKTFTATIYLGELTNIDAGRVVGYTAKLTYDTELVENVTLEQQNGWTVTLTNGAIVASIDNVVANKETAKITFTLKDGIEAGKELNIGLTNGRISNDVNLDQPFSASKKITFTAVEQPKEETPKNEIAKNETSNEIKSLNDITNGTSKNTIKSNTTNQLKASTLPKAGQKNFIIIAICIITIVGLACVVRVKTIKLK